MREYIAKYEVREKVSPEGWIARLYQAAEAGIINMQQCLNMMRDYIGPCLDTTISVSSHLLYQLAKNPDVWGDIRQHPSLIPGAVDEACMSSPVFGVTCNVTQDHSIEDYKLPSGSRVAILFASANRDERHWKDPDSFDVRRRSNEHVGFGHGINMCAGMHLARLDSEVDEDYLVQLRALDEIERVEKSRAHHHRISL
jgi:cytochrome P450